MFGMSPMEMMIVGVVAILLFGQKLPEVMKTIGKGYRDFRNGLSEIQSQVNLNDTFSNSSSYVLPAVLCLTYNSVRRLLIRWLSS